MIRYLNLILLSVATVDPHAPDAAHEQSRFGQDKMLHPEKIRSAQKTRSVQILRQFIRNKPDSLRAKLPEKLQTSIVEVLKSLARKKLPIQKLCKTNDLVINVLSESILSDKPITALTELSATHEAFNFCFYQLSEKFAESETHLTNQLRDFQKTQSQQYQLASFSQRYG